MNYNLLNFNCYNLFELFNELTRHMLSFCIFYKFSLKRFIVLLLVTLSPSILQGYLFSERMLLENIISRLQFETTAM